MVTRQGASQFGTWGRWDRPAEEREGPALAGAKTLASFVDIVGHVDLCGPDMVEGWIFWCSQPDRQLQLDIMVAGQLLGRCDATLFRPDLKKAGYGDGRCAFSFPLPRGVAVLDFATTRARLVNSALYLLPDEATTLWRANGRAGPSKLTTVGE